MPPKLINYPLCCIPQINEGKINQTMSAHIFFFRSTQAGEITVYGLTEPAWQVSSVGLHVEKQRHDYRLKHPQGRQDQKAYNLSPRVLGKKRTGKECTGKKRRYNYINRS